MNNKSRVAEFFKLLLFTLSIVFIVYYTISLKDTPYYNYMNIILIIFVVVVTFISPEKGLYIFIIVSMFSPEINYGRVGRRNILVRYDDIMVVVGIFAWLIIRIMRKDIKFLVSTPLDKPILFFILICALSTSRGVLIRQVDNPKKAFFYILKLIEYFFVYYLVINTIKNKIQLRKFMTIFIITLICSLYIGFDQIMQGVGRISTPFESEPEPNTFGGYLLFMLAIITSMAIMQVRILHKKFLFFLIPIIIWIFLHTLSRGSYLGYFPVMVTMTFLLPKGKRVYGAFIVFLSLILIPYLPDYIKVRIDRTFQGKATYKIPTLLGDEKTIQLDSSSSSRVTKFRNILNYWAEYPIFGLGITGAGFVDSTLFRTIGELGLMGMFAFVWLISTIFSETINSFKYSRNNLNKGLCIGYICGLVGLIIHGTTANTFFLIRIMGPFWFITGLIIMIPQLYFDELAKPAGKNLFLELSDNENK